MLIFNFLLCFHLILLLVKFSCKCSVKLYLKFSDLARFLNALLKW